MLFTIQRCGHLPKRYTFYLGVPLAKDARDMYGHVRQANYREPKTRDDYIVRKGHFKHAIALLFSMVSQIEVILDLVPQSDSIMEKWMEMTDRELRLLTGIMESDEKRISYLR